MKTFKLRKIQSLQMALKLNSIKIPKKNNRNYLVDIVSKIIKKEVDFNSTFTELNLYKI